MVHPPTIIAVTNSSVKMSIIPLRGTSASGMLKYSIKFRKVGGSDWTFTSKHSSLSRTVTGLNANTLYKFKVVVKYRGKTLTSQSVAVQTKATGK